MNNGISAGFLPQKRRVLPHHSLWRFAKLITLTTSSEVVPDNVYKIWAHVYGAGGSGGAYSNVAGTGASGGAGGGYASGIIDVIPGQLLPTITVGAGGTAASSSNNGNTGGTSSFGSLLTATGGGGGAIASSSSPAGGTGTCSAQVTNQLTAAGGVGGKGSSSSIYAGGGGAVGSAYGVGGAGGDGILGASGGGGVVGVNAVYNLAGSYYIKEPAKSNITLGLAEINPFVAFAQGNFAALLPLLTGLHGLAHQTSQFTSGWMYDAKFGAGSCGLQTQSGGLAGTWGSGIPANYGGGSGGVCGFGGGCVSGAGGQGFVILIWDEVLYD